MKNLFSINKTDRPDAMDFDVTPYHAATVSEEVRAKLKGAFAIVEEEYAPHEPTPEEVALRKKANRYWAVCFVCLAGAIALFFADAKAGHMVQIKTPDLGGVNNTIEAVLYCKEKGIGAYQGGTCNETDRSAQVCVQCAMATQPDQILAKPGMGVDEGFMIVYNEMNRILAMRKAKAACKCSK